MSWISSVRSMKKATARSAFTTRFATKPRKSVVRILSTVRQRDVAVRPARIGSRGTIKTTYRVSRVRGFSERDKPMGPYRKPITTALQFAASYRAARITAVGAVEGICWAEMLVNDDGTEDQFVFVLERRLKSELELRVIINPSSALSCALKSSQDLRVFWDQGYTPQHGDDCAW